MTSNDNTIKIEIKATECTKTTKLYLIHIEFTLQYITLNDYCIVNDTLIWQVTTTLKKFKQKQ